jgi:cell division cycle protein 20 (cofactor of APC complex)
VCALQWSATYKEIISGHGFANNQLIIWKYPSLKKVIYNCNGNGKLIEK